MAEFTSADIKHIVDSLARIAVSLEGISEALNSVIVVDDKQMAVRVVGKEII